MREKITSYIMLCYIMYTAIYNFVMYTNTYLGFLDNSKSRQ